MCVCARARVCVRGCVSRMAHQQALCDSLFACCYANTLTHIAASHPQQCWWKLPFFFYLVIWFCSCWKLCGTAAGTPPQEVLLQRGVLLRGLAHPALFAPSPSSSPGGLAAGTRSGTHSSSNTGNGSSSSSGGGGGGGSSSNGSNGSRHGSSTGVASPAAATAMTPPSFMGDMYQVRPVQ